MGCIWQKQYWFNKGMNEPFVENIHSVLFTHLRGLIPKETIVQQSRGSSVSALADKSKNQYFKRNLNLWRRGLMNSIKLPNRQSSTDSLLNSLRAPSTTMRKFPSLWHQINFSSRPPYCSPLWIRIIEILRNSTWQIYKLCSWNQGRFGISWHLWVAAPSRHF